MSNRVVMQEGYEIPFAGFDGYRRRKKRRSSKRKSRRASGGRGRQQSKMKVCAKRWRSAKSGSYRAFMKRCLSK